MSDEDETPDEGTAKIVRLKPPAPPEAIELRAKDDVKFTVIVNHADRFCEHVERTIGRYTRSVQCKRCKAVLDPFDVLLELAEERDRYVASALALRTEIRGAESRLKLLKRLEENASARAKRRGLKASKYYFDRLLAYAREHTRRPDYEQADLERILSSATYANGPVTRLKAVAQALERGAGGAALELLRLTVDELEAAFGVADEERRRA